MKPRVFIGSSTEGLDIAYAIQENIEYDSNPTVWNQGIFNLSGNTLDDLLGVLDNCDFGIFVFQPDDITEIRRDALNTVRDNVIFELGLFIGRLGKKRVFFVVPDRINDFHLPTDLLGVSPGRYNNERDDGNITAALGPFCNQVRKALKNFLKTRLIDLDGESDRVKDLAINKDGLWEFKLTCELLKTRLVSINQSYDELDKGLVYQKSKNYGVEDFISWVIGSTNDLKKLIEILTKLFNEEMINAFGEPGEDGNVIEIKSVVDRIASVCKELLEWEYELQGVIPPEEFIEVVDIMKGWTKTIVSVVQEFPGKIEDGIKPDNLKKNDNVVSVHLTLPPLTDTDRVNQIINEFTEALRDQNYR